MGKTGQPGAFGHHPANTGAKNRPTQESRVKRQREFLKS